MASATALNGEAGGQKWNDPRDSNNFVYLTFIFPELRNLAGYFLCWTDFTGGFSAVDTSVNTTNGIDGTWVAQAAPGYTVGAPSPAFRSAVTTLSVAGIIAIRFRHQNPSGVSDRGPVCAHLYGSIASGVSLDRLRIWHPTLDQEMGAAGFDFGDFGRTGTIDRTFRVKNNSSSLTANSVVLSTTAITDASPTVLSQMSLSQGGAFASTQNIGALAPSAISGICTLRIATSGSTALSVWRQRLVATAGSWT